MRTARAQFHARARNLKIVVDNAPLKVHGSRHASNEARSQPQPKMKVLRYTVEFLKGEEGKVAPMTGGTVMVPTGGRFLSAGLGTKGINLWALVDPDADPEPRLIQFALTGETEIDPGATFIATLQIGNSKPLHIFETPA